MRFGKTGASQFAVPIGALQPDLREDVPQLLIVGLVPERFAQVGVWPYWKVRDGLCVLMDYFGSVPALWWELTSLARFKAWLSR